MKRLDEKTKMQVKHSAQKLGLALLASAALLVAPAAIAADDPGARQSTRGDAAGLPPETGATRRGEDTGLPREADTDGGLRGATQDAGERMGAAWVRGKIEGAYLFNRQLNPLDIQVDVEDETVTLTGEVDSEAHKDLAEEIALSIEQVSEVNNQLRVSPEAGAREDAVTEEARGTRGAISDGAVSAHVKAQLLANPNLPSTDVEVSAEEGKVKLSGTVETEEQKDLAEYVANNTAGVRDVENNLQVKVQ